MNKLQELTKKYNIPVPRYTSYPPANHFKEGITQAQYRQQVEASNQGEPKNIAFYVHIPFCNKICYYCGCNACRATNNNQVSEYIAALNKEIAMLTAMLDPGRKISQVHFGGGTPNAISAEYIMQIMQHLSQKHTFTPNPEIAIECNPAWLTTDYVNNLLKAGFNRISLGVQDFNHNVLKNVNREIPNIPVNELMAYIRSKSPAVSINLDFIYGLPGQTANSFTSTIQQAAALQPERLVTFSYAHVPWMKKHQQILEKKGLPTPNEKTNMFWESRRVMLENNYQPIGLDHYVLPNDDLNKALQNQQLHRNFQGYCTRQTTGQVYAFGASAICQLQQGYLQHVKEVPQYIQLVNEGLFPVEKGYFLSRKETLIKEAITEVMCNGRFNIPAFCQKNKITHETFTSIFNWKDEALQNFIDDDLVSYCKGEISVSETGNFFIRNIAALLDPTYQPQQNKYSKSV